MTCTVVPQAAQLDAAEWAELEALVEASLRRRPLALQRRLRLFLSFVEWAPVPRYGRRFSSLDPQRQERFLRWLETHRIDPVRLGFWGLRTLALLGYYGRRAAAEAIGYRPDPRGWEAN